MEVLKWNFKKHEYESANIPNDSLVCCLMSEKTRCVNCGKKMMYADSYVSLQYHNYRGFGYPVCETCYQKELKNKLEEERGKWGK